MTPVMTWCGKCAAMKTLERQTHTWTAQNTVHRMAFRYLENSSRRSVSGSGAVWFDNHVQEATAMCISSVIMKFCILELLQCLNPSDLRKNLFLRDIQQQQQQQLYQLCSWPSYQLTSKPLIPLVPFYPFPPKAPWFELPVVNNQPWERLQLALPQTSDNLQRRVKWENKIRTTTTPTTTRTQQPTSHGRRNSCCRASSCGPRRRGGMSLRCSRCPQPPWRDQRDFLENINTHEHT